MTMLHRLLALTIAVGVLTPAPARAQGLVLDTFRSYLESLRVQAGIPGLTVAVIGQDSVLWESAFGEQDIQRALATRTDTPFHVDGLTQIVTATLVLSCVEDGRLSLEDSISQFSPEAADPTATIRELLTHTSPGFGGVEFSYRPQRLDGLQGAVESCTGQSFRQTVGTLLNRLGMASSVPGADVIDLAPTLEYRPPVERYDGVLQRLATPYAVDGDGRAVESSYGATTLSPSTGLISTVQDFVWFDLELKNGLLVGDGALALAWQPPIGGDGLPLPHGLGWFVERYGSQRVVWQFGVGENASSSLIVTVPDRGLTLVALANSDGLATPFTLAEGGLTQSPFARLFLELFVQE